MKWDALEDKFIELYDSGKISEISNSDLFEFIYRGENIYEGENRRWSQTIETIVEIKGRLFLFSWERGLTEYQENEIWENPQEVRRVVTEIIVPEHKEIQVDYVPVVKKV